MKSHRTRHAEKIVRETIDALRDLAAAPQSPTRRPGASAHMRVRCGAVDVADLVPGDLDWSHEGEPF